MLLLFCGWLAVASVGLGSPLSWCLAEPPNCTPPQYGTALPPIFWINLDDACQRQRRMGLMLEAHGFTHNRVSGVQGNTFRTRTLHGAGPKSPLEFEGRWDDHTTFTITTASGIVNRKDAKRFTKGELGCLLSHIRTIGNAYRAGLAAALVMEDDVSLELLPLWDQNSDLQAVMRAVEAASESRWEVLQLTWLLFQRWPRKYLLSLFANGTLVTKRWTDRLYGTQAYLIHRRGMARLLRAFWGPKPWPPSPLRSVDIRSIVNPRADSFLYSYANTYVCTRPLFVYHVTGSAIATSSTAGQADNAKWIRGLYPPRLERLRPHGGPGGLVCTNATAVCAATGAQHSVRLPPGILLDPKCAAAATVHRFSR